MLISKKLEKYRKHVTIDMFFLGGIAMEQKYMLTRRMQIEKFLDDYPGMFNEYEEATIRYYAGRVLTDEMLANDLMREVYDELGMIPKDRNLYIDFIRFIQEIYPIKDMNIVEVGGGILPKLGERISKMIGNGHITVYDPLITKYKKSTNRLTIKREYLTEKTPIGKTDLIVGLKPCKGAEAIIKAATKNDIDFIIGLCEGGLHGDEYDYFESDDEWLSSTISFAERRVTDMGMGQLIKRRINKPYYQYPIIYNRREIK